MQKLHGNMGSIFWPSGGTLDGRVLTQIDQQYGQNLTCDSAKSNLAHLQALLAATPPDGTASTQAYINAYNTTISKLQGWIESYCPVDITPLPGSPGTVTPSGSTTTPTTNTAQKPGGSLALLFLAGGLIYLANKKKKRSRKN